MSETTNEGSTIARLTARARRLVAFEGWRLSEFIVIGGVVSLGVLILAIHLATWGAEIRRDAKLLREVDCVVLDRAIYSRPAPDGDGSVYRPEVLIEYEYGGQKYKIATFDRLTLTADQGFVYDRDSAILALLPYPPQMKTTCWLRVDAPAQAFLVRNSTIWGWIFLIIPSSLILFGGIWMIVRAREFIFSKEALASERRQKTTYPTLPSIPPRAVSRGVVLARRLSSDVKSRFRFSASAFGATAWNLAAWGGFFYVLASAETRLDYWLAMGFLVFFCGIGFLFACRLWREYRVECVVGSTALEISTLPILPGRKVKCCLFLKGRVEAKRLDVFIRCEEVARYLQGTNSICNRHEVFSRTLFTKYGVSVGARREERETFSAQLPLGVAPSFVAEHNEIDWKFTVRLEFADGGAFQRDFAVVVFPSRVSERDG